MSRPLRLAYPGSLWHITSRGNRKQHIFRDDRDRELFLDLLGACVKRCAWIVPAYVLMSNHFHLLVELTGETLSRGMQWLNGKYSQAFNRRHHTVGHLLQGRFHGRLIEKESYFLEVLRYVVLNPVRAGIVPRPEAYVWSSHRAVIADTPAPDWLAVDDVLAQFAPNRRLAVDLYRNFVDAAIGAETTPWSHLVGQIYLGSEEWIKHVRERIDLKPRCDDHAREQLGIGAPSMADIVAAVAKTFGLECDQVRLGPSKLPRMVAAWIGWNETLLTNREIAAALRLRSSGHISVMIRRCDQRLDRDEGLRATVDRCLSTLRRKTKIKALTPLTLG